MANMVQVFFGEGGYTVIPRLSRRKRLIWLVNVVAARLTGWKIQLGVYESGHVYAICTNWIGQQKLVKANSENQSG